MAVRDAARALRPVRSHDCLRALPTIVAMRAFDVQVSGAGIVGKSLCSGAGAPRPLGRAARRARAVGAARRRPRLCAQRRHRWLFCAASRSGMRSPADATTPVHDMVVHGDGVGATLEFSAWEQRVGELAVITDAAALEHELDVALRFAPHVTRVDGDVARGAHRALRRARLGATGRARRRRRAQRLRPARDRRAPGREPAASAHRAPMVSHARRARAAAVRPARGGAFVRAGLVARRRARRRIAGRRQPPPSSCALADAAGAEVGALTLASERASWPLVLGRAERGAGPAGCCSATPPTSSIRSPARASTSAWPTSPRSPR